MNQITLHAIHKINNRIAYDFSVSEGLFDFFSGEEFVIEYPENIEQVPDSVAVIPFVCNVLPIIWITNSSLVLEEIDEAFYNCIPHVRKGYETMFPESKFLGEINADQIVPCDIAATGSSAVFFSGGLDAVHTLIRHLNESPMLVSIWGSDINYDNVSGWETVHQGIAEYSGKYNLPDVVIRSTFREFDNEAALTKAFGKQLKDNWWHGMKHGIGLLGHAAPYAYLKGISSVYIASSFCPDDGVARCASSPLTDDHVHFANAKVIHDSFECSRQDKIHNVLEYVRKTGEKISLHVCWESRSGGNCCRCEKCYRTIAGLLAEGADPVAFGFADAPDTVYDMQRSFVYGNNTAPAIIVQWRHIQNAVLKNQNKIKKGSYWKYIRWLRTLDLDNPSSWRLSFLDRVCRKINQKTRVLKSRLR